MLELAYSISQEFFFLLFSKWAYFKTKVEISFYFLVTVLQCQFMRITELILTLEHINVSRIGKDTKLTLWLKWRKPILIKKRRQLEEFALYLFHRKMWFAVAFCWSLRTLLSHPSVI